MRLVAKDDDPNKPKPKIQILQIFGPNLWVRLYVGEMTNGFPSLKEVDYDGYGAVPVPRTFKYWLMKIGDDAAFVHNKKEIKFPKVKKIRSVFGILPKIRIKITYMALTDRHGFLISNYLVKLSVPLFIKKGDKPSVSPGGFLIDEKF